MKRVCELGVGDTIKHFGILWTVERATVDFIYLRQASCYKNFYYKRKRLPAKSRELVPVE